MLGLFNGSMIFSVILAIMPSVSLDLPFNNLKMVQVTTFQIFLRLSGIYAAPEFMFPSI